MHMRRRKIVVQISMIPMHENLKGRVAVITGGSGVLCSEMARELARQGVKVAILNRTAEKGQEIVDQIIENGGTAIAIAADVLDRASLEHARDEIVKRTGVSMCSSMVQEAIIRMPLQIRKFTAIKKQQIIFRFG